MITDQQNVIRGGHVDKVITIPDAVPAQRVLNGTPKPATPYLELDLGIVRRQLTAIRAALPGTAIHYAVKCNPHPRVISALAAEGCNFEIASASELDLLLDAGAAQSSLLFSNPVKAPSQIGYAHAKGVTIYAADCVDEVDKLARYAPGACVLFRVDVSNRGSVLPLAGKFGADEGDVADLALFARDRGLVPHGLTFHVGSQALDAGDWRDALLVCAGIMRRLLTVGIRLALVDLGGGYPVPYGAAVVPVSAIGLAVRSGVDELPYPVALAAEPGRFLTAEAGTMVASVIGRADRRGVTWLHLDVGAFGGLMEALETRRGLHYPVLCAHAHATPPRLTAMSITGPTCDSEDTVLIGAPVCSDLRTGDIVHIAMTGAYTTAYASTFNGFPLPAVVTRERVATGGSDPLDGPFHRPLDRMFDRPIDRPIDRPLTRS
ncbi:MAG: ornithine decarboxylase [Frankiales bacterium]|nr:ornithine decarboxylase [Frankiales bacterium]